MERFLNSCLMEYTRNELLNTGFAMENNTLYLVKLYKRSRYFITQKKNTSYNFQLYNTTLVAKISEYIAKFDVFIIK